MSGKEFATRLYRCHYSLENNVIFDETVGCFVIFERWVPHRKRALTINFFHFGKFEESMNWEVAGYQPLRTLVNTLQMIEGMSHLVS